MLHGTETRPTKGIWKDILDGWVQLSFQYTRIRPSFIIEQPTVITISHPFSPRFWKAAFLGCWAGLPRKGDINIDNMIRINANSAKIHELDSNLSTKHVIIYWSQRGTSTIKLTCFSQWFGIRGATVFSLRSNFSRCFS